jgi:hypothetical protein
MCTSQDLARHPTVVNAADAGDGGDQFDRR